MAFVTYILLSTLLAGLHGSFDPSLLLNTGSSVLAVVTLELLILYLGSYLLSISAESRFLDLVAYSGYKFVGVITTILLASILNPFFSSSPATSSGSGGWIGWSLFIYTFLANAFFLLRSLKYVLLPDSSNPAGPSAAAGPAASYTLARAQRNRRTQFLFGYAYLVQFVFMWMLTRQDGRPPAGSAAAVAAAAAAKNGFGGRGVGGRGGAVGAGGFAGR